MITMRDVNNSEDQITKSVVQSVCNVKKKCFSKQNLLLIDTQKEMMSGREHNGTPLQPLLSVGAEDLCCGYVLIRCAASFLNTGNNFPCMKVIITCIISMETGTQHLTSEKNHILSLHHHHHYYYYMLNTL